ncbi:uncharacterized protein LOC121476357 [Vulpes lagopus]|uniref:uncharacterized protein LOC121476357 n=1 Tax=Vulpes lagopus TaxID=494514 RepID=UPI001BC8EB5A|nr:uncharacterized protein LOC121476357 [Vulpes lagopus]
MLEIFASLCYSQIKGANWPSDDNMFLCHLGAPDCKDISKARGLFKFSSCSPLLSVRRVVVAATGQKERPWNYPRRAWQCPRGRSSACKAGAGCAERPVFSPHPHSFSCRLLFPIPSQVRSCRQRRTFQAISGARSGRYLMHWGLGSHMRFRHSEAVPLSVTLLLGEIRMRKSGRIHNRTTLGTVSHGREGHVGESAYLRPGWKARKPLNQRGSSASPKCKRGGLTA